VPGTFQPFDRQLVWMDRQDRSQSLALPLRPYSRARLAPDHLQVVMEIDDGNRQQIWVHDVQRAGSLAQVAVGTANAQYPTFMPDGRRIMFSSSPSSETDMYSLRLVPTDGSAQSVQILTAQEWGIWSMSSPDERFLVYQSVPFGGGYDIWVMPMDGDGEPRRLIDSPSNEQVPWLSPDGRWLAYHSDESGRGEIYIRSFPNAEERRATVSTEGSSIGVVWARNGELFYLNGDRMMAVDVEAGADLVVGSPQELFRLPFPVSAEFDVTADGSQFLMVRTGDEGERYDRINIVQNFFTELERLVPTN